jgi:hypothetical protein
VSSKSKKKPLSYTMSLTKAVDNALTIFMWAFASGFSPEPDQFERLKHEVQSVRDSIISGALTIPQLRKALKEDYGWEGGS